ncbi:MAG: metallophosphoesterase, partial [Lachnospiraceae bacterium]|nr:metallophosphoesterase [Lachnospiraceae bacterium]
MEHRNIGKKLCKYIKGVTAFLVLTVLLAAGVFTMHAAADTAGDRKAVDLLCTHDLHSCLEGYITTRGMQHGAEVVEAGGFARLKTLIDRKRAQNPDTLVVDAGDYPMGTLYQVLYTTDAPEIRMLGRMGYDAVTFGNHDFDYGSEALADMFRVATESGDPRPAFVINNFDFTSDNTGSKMIYEALKEYGYSD